MLRKTLTILSLIGLVITFGLWGVSCVDDVSIGRGGSEVVLSGGWIGYEKYGPQLPWPRMTPVIWSVGVPLFIPAALFAIFPGIELARRRRRLRGGSPRLCVHCDYDLRGLPEPRCPECGTPFDEAATGPQRFAWVRRTGKAAVWGKAAALSSFAVLGVGMFYLLDLLARSVLGGDLLSLVSEKTGLSDNAAIPVIIAVIVTLSFACAVSFYVRIAFRRVPDSRNADS